MSKSAQMHAVYQMFLLCFATGSISDTVRRCKKTQPAPTHQGRPLPRATHRAGKVAKLAGSAAWHPHLPIVSSRLASVLAILPVVGLNNVLYTPNASKTTIAPTPTILKTHRLSLAYTRAQQTTSCRRRSVLWNLCRRTAAGKLKLILHLQLTNNNHQQSRPCARTSF